MKSGRRTLLKALTLCGSAATVTKLPTTWSRPVIESIALPAHAQLTGLCTIQVNFSMELEGNWTGSGGAFLFDSSECYLEFNSAGPFDRSFSFPELGPGTYYFTAGGGFGGSSGAGALLLELVCCDRDERRTASDSGDGGDGDGMDVMITIRDDGTCDMRSGVEIPKAPCPI